MPVGDLHVVLRIMEECGGARTLDGFRERVAESFARHLGYRNVAFFVGATPVGLFLDEAPFVVGRARRMAPAYIEHFRRTDPFVAAIQMRPSPGPVPLSLEECAGGRVMEHRYYMEQFMFRNRIRDKVVIPLPGRSAAAGIGVLAEEAGAFGARDRAKMALLAPHLANLFALHAGSGSTPPRARQNLTGRQLEVARLAAAGASTREIAAVLVITENTVKRHLTAVFARLGCRSRSQLAAIWHHEMGGGQPAAPQH